jgi:hypothetical protein
VDVSATDTERGVMAANRVGVRRLEEAVHLSIRIVKELNLTNAKFICFVIFGVSSDLCDCLVGQL